MHATRCIRLDTLLTSITHDQELDDVTILRHLVSKAVESTQKLGSPRAVVLICFKEVVRFHHYVTSR